MYRQAKEAPRIGCSLPAVRVLVFAGVLAAGASHAAPGGTEPALATIAARSALPVQAANGNSGSAEQAARRKVRYVWRVNHGDRISDAFRAWARQASKWQVVWEAPELVALASVDVDGSFEDAVSKVIDALNQGDAGLVARFYIDSANSVLRVMEKK